MECARRQGERPGRSDAGQLNALRVWPARLHDIGFGALGVFPAGDAEAYRQRPEDARIAQAVEAGKSILVVGPPRVGKSRTAGLQWLIDNDPDVGAGVPKVLLWLDGLDRFLGVVSPSVLTSLKDAADPEIQVVATMRSGLWHELLHVAAG